MRTVAGRFGHHLFELCQISGEIATAVHLQTRGTE
jgi:hypothetical protein